MGLVSQLKSGLFLVFLVFRGLKQEQRPFRMYLVISIVVSM